MTYSETNREVIKNFLHTAVLIDDEIVWEASSHSLLDAPEEPLEAPDEFDDGANTPDDSGGAPLKSKLIAKDIISSFSGYGIVCSPYKWEKNDTDFPNSSEKADLLILDWKLEADSEGKGGYAKRFIKARLENDISKRERLRFICIYTSEKAEDVLESLVETLEDLNGVSLERQNEFIDILSRANHRICRINVVSKSVPENSLADALVSGFSDFVSGFLPNILLSSITEIRNKTYELLASYHRGLDVPAISHYTALKSQKATFETSEIQFREYVSNLVSSSISSNLHFSELLKKTSSESSVISYLGEQDKITLRSGNELCDEKPKVIEILNSQTYEELIKTTKQALKLEGKKKWEDFKSGNKPLQIEGENEDCFLEFSVLDLLKRVHPQPFSDPVLRLGTIVKDRECDLFYLCIQPLCDGVRLANHDENYPFPFLKLEIVKNSGSFNFVIPVNGDFKKFKCETKPRNITAFSFKPDKQKMDVRSQRDEADQFHYFRATDPEKYFIWLAELKDIYAQETLNLLAHQGSRVGSNKFEWLRKKNT